MRVITIGGEEFRIQGAMIACNSEGEALSPGALAGDASAANQAAVQANAGSNAAKAVSVQGIASGKPLVTSNAAIGATTDSAGDATVLGQALQTNETLDAVLGGTGDGAWNGTDPNPTIMSVLKAIAINTAA